jgi:hypothetical protein
MPTVGEIAKEILLPVIQQVIRQHETEGCHIADGADERALAAAVRSLKADEEYCAEEAETQAHG